jgi:hypothetical protein
LLLLVSAGAGLVRRYSHDDFDFIHPLSWNFMAHQTLSPFQLPVKVRDWECGASRTRIASFLYAVRVDVSDRHQYGVVW